MYREEIKQVITALDDQFEGRVFDWRRQAKEISEKEEKFLEDRLKLREDQQATIDELRMRDAEDIHAAKIKLETDVQSEFFQIMSHHGIIINIMT